MSITRDAFPENYSYADTGCSISKTCQSCPLPRCKYDSTEGEQAQLELAARYRHLVENAAALPASLALEDKAKQLGVGLRTLYRAMRATGKVGL